MASPKLSEIATRLVNATKQASPIPWLRAEDIWAASASGTVPKLMMGIFRIAISNEDRDEPGKRAVFRTSPFWSALDEHPSLYFYTARREETEIHLEGQTVIIYRRTFTLKQRSGVRLAPPVPVIRELVWLAKARADTVDTPTADGTVAWVSQRSRMKRTPSGAATPPPQQTVQYVAPVTHQPTPYETFSIRYNWARQKPPTPDWQTSWGRNRELALWELAPPVRLAILNIVLSRLVSSAKFCPNLHFFFRSSAGPVTIPVTDELAYQPMQWVTDPRNLLVHANLQRHLVQLPYLKLDLPSPFLHLSIGSLPTLGVTVMPLFTGELVTQEGQLDSFGVLHGWGKHTGPSSTYEGFWVHGVPTGKGRMTTFVNGKLSTLFQGELENAYPHGRGRMETFDEEGRVVQSVEGDWRLGQLVSMPPCAPPAGESLL